MLFSRSSLVRLVVSGTIALTALAPAATQSATAAYADAQISTATVTVPMVFPVIGQTSYVDTFLACRSGCARKHFGQDLMGPKMRPLVATFNGVVSSIKRESYVGEGNYVTIKGDNGWSANYLHVNNDTPGTDDGRGTARYAFAEGLRVGKRVFAGELLGWSGDSGNAESTGPHLHFELRKGDSWSGVVYNAFSSLNHATRIAKPAVSGPHADGVYIRSCLMCPAFLLDSGKKRYLRKDVAAQLGWNGAMAATVSPGEVNYYPRASDVELPTGRAYQGPDGRLWFADNHARIAVANVAALAPLGITAARVRKTTDEGLATLRIAATTTLPATPAFEGATLKSPDGATIWYVKGGVRRVVPDVVTMRSWGLDAADAVTVTPEMAATQGFPPVATTPLVLKDGNVMRDSIGALWLVTGASRKKFPSRNVYSMYGFATVTQLPLASAVITRLPINGLMLP